MRILILFLTILPVWAYAIPLDERIVSPDRSVEGHIWIDQNAELRWEVTRNGKTVLEEGRLGVIVNGQDLGRNVSLISMNKTSTDRTYPFRGGKAEAFDRTNGLTIKLRTGETEWQIEARAAYDGFAFRAEIEGQGSRTVNGESSEFRLPPSSLVWFGERNTPYKLRTYAVEFQSAKIEEMQTVSSQGPVQLPPIVAEANGMFVLLTEAASFNYSGLRLKAIDSQTFVPDFTEGEKGFTLEGRIVTPWRVVVCVDDLNALVNTTFVDNLAPLPDPKLFSDTSYIRPGRAVWRWHLRHVGSLDDQKAYVDFATQLGYEYSVVDEGWAGWKDGSLAELCKYAKEKNIGIVVWKRWTEVSKPANDYEQLRIWLDSVAEAGVAGIKMDFFDSESLVHRLGEEAVLREAAKRKLVVNFHGCPKPTGEAVRYPNELTREAVRGLELNYMTEAALPASHNAALPFTRYVIGAGDYTPLTFRPERMNGTTLAHQLATLVCMLSPMLIVNAYPEEMLNHTVPAVTQFVKDVPAVWDETVVLPGSKIGDLAVLARRKGERWFIAGLNGAGSRTYTLKGEFLKGKTFSGTLISDRGAPTELATREVKLDEKSEEKITLSPGGGFVLVLDEQRNN